MIRFHEQLPDSKQFILIGLEHGKTWEQSIDYWINLKSSLPGLREELRRKAANQVFRIPKESLRSYLDRKRAELRQPV